MGVLSAESRAEDSGKDESEDRDHHDRSYQGPDHAQNGPLVTREQFALREREDQIATSWYLPERPPNVLRGSLHLIRIRQDFKILQDLLINKTKGGLYSGVKLPSFLCVNPVKSWNPVPSFPSPSNCFCCAN